MPKTSMIATTSLRASLLVAAALACTAVQPASAATARSMQRAYAASEAMRDAGYEQLETVPGSIAGAVDDDEVTGPGAEGTPTLCLGTHLDHLAGRC